MAAYWYKAGPGFWRRWINPRAATPLAEKLDATLVTSVIVFYILSLFEVPEWLLLSLAAFVMGMLLLHVFGVLFRTAR